MERWLVQATSGKPADIRKGDALGTCSSWPAGCTTFLAYPPPVSSEQTCRATAARHTNQTTQLHKRNLSSS